MCSEGMVWVGDGCANVVMADPSGALHNMSVFRSHRGAAVLGHVVPRQGTFIDFILQWCLS